MESNSKPPKFQPQKLISELKTNPELQKQVVPEKGVSPQLAMLRNWQSARLEKTYFDLLADPKDGPACRFFLTDIYAARDFSQREADADRIHSFLSKILPAPALRLLTESIAANRVTHELDAQLLDVLVNQLGVTDSITADQYAEGYRLCDNYIEREAQIDLIYKVLREVTQGSKQPVVGAALKLAHKPASAAGYADLHDFLNRGYQAFRGLRKPKEFAETIKSREMRILQRIYAGEKYPFL